MFDLIIKNGLVASEYNVLPLDVAVHAEKVVALGVHGQFDRMDAAKVIDATGNYVLPGGVDAHVHYDLRLSDAMKAQSPVAGSRAGLYGGTTTYIDFSMPGEGQDLIESVQDKLRVTAEQRPNSDYALHAIVTGDWPMSYAEQMKEVISGGVVSFKFFTTFRGSPSLGGVMTDDGRIYSAMLETERHGGITMVHCEDECIIDYNTRRLYAEGRPEFWNIGESRPPLAEEAAVRRMLLLAERTGSPLYIVHVSAMESVDALTEARAKGVNAFAEVLHPNLVFDPELYRLPHGQRLHELPAEQVQGTPGGAMECVCRRADPHSGQRRLYFPSPGEDFRRHDRQRHGRDEQRRDTIAHFLVRGRDEAQRLCDALRQHDRSCAGQAFRPLR
jgi:dihydropyrimidinase